MKLSAVLAVRNEEPMLESCLELLGFCDEIVVVVDDRSTDGTEAIARRFTDRVWLEPFEDFSQLKNTAIERALGDWVLIVDADERITPALAAEVERAIASEPSEWAFLIDTINFFLGRRMRHGGWVEQHIRLVRRDKAVYSGDIHETFDIPADRLGSLREGMWHFSHRRIEHNLVKTVEFGQTHSRELHEAGAPRVTPARIVVAMVREFLRRFVLLRGYKDGMPGFLEAMFQPLALFCIQGMLWQRQRSESLEDTYAELERQAAAHR